MDNVQQAFLKIVSNVRGHLELQRALGVSAIEMPNPGDFVRQQDGMITVEKGSISAHPAALDALRKEMLNCTRCKLCTGRKNIVFGEGDPAAMLVFIGERPGPEEDGQGKPFMGETGQLLTDIIVKGMKLKREDVYICNMVKCRPSDDRCPEPDEIKICEQFLLRQLQAINPKILVALGDSVAKALLKSNEGILTLRGKWGKYHDIPVMPTLHPADLLKNPSDKKFVWEDIKKVITEMEKAGKR